MQIKAQEALDNSNENYYLLERELETTQPPLQMHPEPIKPHDKAFRSDKRFIFITGHHRSGTSLLHRIIKDHPSVSGFDNTGAPEDEGQHLQSVFKTSRFFGGPGKYIFNRQSHMDENHYLANNGSASKIFHQWSAYWDTSKDWLVEKSPPNIVRTRFLQKLFPNSAFIAIYRHPAAIAYATQKWIQSDITSLIDHTLTGYEIQKHDFTHIKKSYSLKYENLINNTSKVASEIFEFLGIPSQSYTLKQNINHKIDELYLGKWESQKQYIMSEKLLRNFNKRSAKFGYSLL